MIAHELMALFNIDMKEHKLREHQKTYDIDIIINNERIIVEFDSFRYHEKNEERDRRKTRELVELGWRVIRVREIPLTRLCEDDVTVSKGNFKEAVNKTLLKIQDILTYRIQGLEKYLEMEELQKYDQCEQFMRTLIESKVRRQPVTLHD